MRICIRHWLPILTWCPVNNLPDLIYVTIHLEVDGPGNMLELYGVRREVRKLVSGQKMFMEDIALLVREYYLDKGVRTGVEVRLFLNRHVVYVPPEFS